MHIRVSVSPGAKKESFEETKTGRFKISVKERAERNEANDRVRFLVARYFKIPLSAVRIISGHRRSAKLIALKAGSHT